MAIYTIADLHLSLNTNKPMDVFGQNWENYVEKIKKSWIEKVKEEDLVILPGDFSWSTYLEEMEKDFEFINNLPGKKILLKGNHDYWWSTVTSMKKYLENNNFKNISFLYNNSYEFDNKIIVGTRGWTISGLNEDIKLTKREVERFKFSIESGINQFGKNKEIVAFLHYPPVVKNCLETDYIKIMNEYNIKRCYYGHLHANSIQDAIQGNIKGIKLKLVSADALNFELIKI